MSRSFSCLAKLNYLSFQQGNYARFGCPLFFSIKCESKNAPLLEIKLALSFSRIDTRNCPFCVFPISDFARSHVLLSSYLSLSSQIVSPKLHVLWTQTIWLNKIVHEAVHKGRLHPCLAGISDMETPYIAASSDYHPCMEKSIGLRCPRKNYKN